MGHHSYITIGRREFLASRDGYDSELAALFQEGDRLHLPEDDGAENFCRYGYFARAWQLRQRLHAQGFTTSRALADLEAGIRKWRKRDMKRSHPDSAAVLPPDVSMLLNSLRRIVAVQPTFEGSDFEDPEEWAEFEAFDEVARTIDELRWYTDTRSLLRLLLDSAPDDADVGLALHELTGCCVELDADQPVAETARASQLNEVSVNAPLIVLTEGRTDSRLLRLAMSVTHPHLTGFVNFIDFDGVSGAEGGVGSLSKTVYAFIAAGVANRFVAIADNDTEGHAGLAKIKKERLPSNCRLIHYPDLELLSSYPTVGPYSEDPVIADVNGRAGSLEMYFGFDSLRINGRLAPVQWRNFNTRLGRYHGALSDSDKRLVQDAFEKKVELAQRNRRLSESEDWAGVIALVEHIIHAFD